MGKNSKFNNTLTLRVVNALRNESNGKMQLIVSSQCDVVGNFPIVSTNRRIWNKTAQQLVDMFAINCWQLEVE